MHLKFHRRRAFGLLFGKRYPNPQTVSGTIISGDHDHDQEDDSTVILSGIFTGPVTITVTTLIPDPTSETSLSASTTGPLSTSSSASASSSITTSGSSTTVSTSPAMTTALQTSTSLTSFFTTSSSASAVVVPTPSASVSIRPIASSSAETSKLPAGAIVGVVIALFLALVVSIIVVLRKRSVRNRVKLRVLWTKNDADKGISSDKYPFPAESSPVVQPFVNTSTSWNSGGRGGEDILANKAPITQPRVPVPRFIATPPPIIPAALGFEERSRSPGSRRGSQLVPPAMPAAMEERSMSPGPKRGSQLNVSQVSPPPLSPFGATVKYTFYTNLPDELQITVGERVRILAEYDDGWGLCLNARGEQGVIPLECIDRGDGLSISPARLHTSMSVKRRTQRMSSLPLPPRSPVAEPKP